MLDSDTAWVAGGFFTPGVDHWLQFDLGSSLTVSGVVTQGRANIGLPTFAPEWVTSYKVQYSNDDLNWNWVDNEYIFTGNIDQNTKVTNTFNTSVLTRYLRILPITGAHPSMRAGVLIN